MVSIISQGCEWSGLIGDGTGDCLSDPPSRIGAELIAAAIFEFIHCLHEPNITFLDQIEELQTTIGIFFSNTDHQSQIRFGKFALGFFIFGSSLR